MGSVRDRQTSSAEQLYRQGVAAHDAGRLDTAITFYERALSVDPTHLSSLNDMGSALDSLGRSDEAVGFFERALKIKPNDHLIWFNKGYALGRSGRDREAVECFERALSIKPDYAKGWLNKGVALEKLGELNAARSAYQKAYDLDRSGQIGSSAQRNLSVLQSQVRGQVGQVEISYEWEGGTNRCIAATATMNGIVIGKATKLSVGGDPATGHYVEIEEVHYSPSGSGEVIYRARVKFRIESPGGRIEEIPISGRKSYDLFREWPMSR